MLPAGLLSVIPLVDCCELLHPAEQVCLSQEGWWVVSALAMHLARGAVRAAAGWATWLSGLTHDCGSAVLMCYT